MPLFKIHRLKQHVYEHFRWAPHTSGSTPVKLRDYEPAGEVEAPTPYAAWSSLRDGEAPLRVGDLLESEQGSLTICKYVGFEEAHWALLEPKPVPEAGAPSSGAEPPHE